MSRSRAHAIMARQDGVVTRDQAVRCGLSIAIIDHYVRSGEWVSLVPGVYLRADRERTPSVHLRAAVYGAGRAATAWGPSAAWWHGILDRPPARYFVTVPHGRAIVRNGNVHLRRRDLPADDIVTVRRLRVTGVPLTVLEAAVELKEGSVLMDRALQRHTSLALLERSHRRNPGRRGSRAAEKLLCTARDGGHSQAERIFHRLLRQAGFTGWRAHVMSCGYEIDVAFEAERVAIEIDGWVWHRDADRHCHDIERQNVLINAGWHVLRFTWHMLTQDPDGVVRRIRAALGRTR
ncbi:DUF559 domain-containing protein [Rhodococcus pyridinivorans]|nr:DUF559 domain-containing protein [Rhodococcus pyridinivorans]UTM37483.1 DUF559 domain-containing protein [Rhodococcus pyridinivorans]